jgi:phosphopantetheine adenylyltransferase
MKKFSEIREARGDTCVFTFGRFNPPTTGHEKLLDAVATQAKKNPGAPYYVFASHSENAKKDPLPYAKKVAYMKKMFPKHSRNIVVDKARNVFEIAVSLHNKGHKSIVMVVGSDRVAEFDSLLNKYNGVEARHGYYGFDNIEVVSAGERDPDAEGVTGMSASKMRAAASANDFDSVQTWTTKRF